MIFKLSFSLRKKIKEKHKFQTEILDASSKILEKVILNFVYFVYFIKY